jgi:hypothetical protein
MSLIRRANQSGYRKAEVNSRREDGRQRGIACLHRLAEVNSMTPGMAQQLGFRRLIGG